MLLGNITQSVPYSLMRRSQILRAQDLGFPCSSVGKESALNARDPVQILGQEDPLETETATHSCILA